MAETIEQRLLAKIRSLPSVKITEVEDFIDFLHHQEKNADSSLTIAAMKLSEPSFAKIWDNPEDAEYDNF
jgi:hypothetical protein